MYRYDNKPFKSKGMSSSTGTYSQANKYIAQSQSDSVEVPFTAQKASLNRALKMERDLRACRMQCLQSRPSFLHKFMILIEDPIQCESPAEIWTKKVPSLAFWQGVYTR